MLLGIDSAGSTFGPQPRDIAIGATADPVTAGAAASRGVSRCFYAFGRLGAIGATWAAGIQHRIQYRGCEDCWPVSLPYLVISLGVQPAPPSRLGGGAALGRGPALGGA